METPTTELSTRLLAKDVMTPHVLSVASDMPIEDLASFLISRGISGAPVTNEDDELIGVVSITDIARHDGLPTTYSRQRHGTHHEVYLKVELDALEKEFDEEELDGFNLEGGSGTTVAGIMTPMVYGVVEKMPIQDVADCMIRGKIHRQFVTRGHRVVGVISAMDLLRVIRDLPR
jgi:CBS domain-containing protein